MSLSKPLRTCSSPPLGVSGCLAEMGDQRRQIIYDSIKSAEWKIPFIDSLYTFRFKPDGSGSGGFYILNYQQDPDTDAYAFKQVRWPTHPLVGAPDPSISAARNLCFNISAYGN